MCEVRNIVSINDVGPIKEFPLSPFHESSSVSFSGLIFRDCVLGDFFSVDPRHSTNLLVLERA